MSNNPNHIRLVNQQPHKAKIFLSCGQATKKERLVAKNIHDTLESNGFKVFMAVSKNTITELDRELLDHLKTSDYFLFINFTREILLNMEGKPYSFRGSLYTNQELAMARALGFDSTNMLIFSDKRIERDGLLKNIIANDCEFAKTT